MAERRRMTVTCPSWGGCGGHGTHGYCNGKGKVGDYRCNCNEGRCPRCNGSGQVMEWMSVADDGSVSDQHGYRISGATRSSGGGTSSYQRGQQIGQTWREHSEAGGGGLCLLWAPVALALIPVGLIRAGLAQVRRSPRSRREGVSRG